MKNRLIKSVLSLAVVVSVSCSSDDQSDPAYVAQPSVFVMSVNGVETFNFDMQPVFKTEKTFQIGENSRPVQLSFREDGNLGYFNVDLNRPSFETSLFYSARDYSSDQITFSIESVDETHKRVKGSFSGYLIADPLNRQSESKFVNGHFDLDYTVRVPAIAAVGNSAKINGQNWSSSLKYITKSGESNQYVVEHDLNNGQYKIEIHYMQSSGESAYSFSNSDLTNKMQLSRFDTATGTYIDYDCSGNFTVDRNVNDILSGSYQFTAVNPENPADVIQVTDGVFKIVYPN